jgi:hypothetical protein
LEGGGESFEKKIDAVKMRVCFSESEKKRKRERRKKEK